MSNAIRILCEQSTQKMAIKRAHHQANIEKISTNFESKPIHDRITMFSSSKIWGLFKASRTSNALEFNQIHGMFVDAQFLITQHMIDIYLNLTGSGQ